MSKFNNNEQIRLFLYSHLFSQLPVSTPGCCLNFKDFKIVRDLLRQTIDVCLITILFPKQTKVK